MDFLLRRSDRHWRNASSQSNIIVAINAKIKLSAT
jgi:hypothetical protein